MSKISLVDCKDPSYEKNFCHSIKETGFAVLKNHPVNINLMEEVFEEWKGFFALPEKTKEEYLFKKEFKECQGGFFPKKVSEIAKGFSVKDLKEFFHYYIINEVPLPKMLSEKTTTLFHELFNFAKTLLSSLEKNLPDTIRNELSMTLSEMVDRDHRSVLRILHYPPIPQKIEDGAIRAAAHEDINLITLLLCDSEPGLQALDLEGNWNTVPSKRGALTINIGDMLAEATRGYYRATKHRVIIPEGAATSNSRYSMPLFLHGKGHVVLSKKYTIESYYRERMKELGLL